MNTAEFLSSLEDSFMLGVGDLNYDSFFDQQEDCEEDYKPEVGGGGGRGGSG